MTTKSTNAKQDEIGAAVLKAAKLQIPAEFLDRLIPGMVAPAQVEEIFRGFKKAFIEKA